MARVNLLDPKGARSPILVTNDGIPEITGDVPVCRTKGPQFGYLPQDDSFIVRTDHVSMAWACSCAGKTADMSGNIRPFSLRL